MSTGRGGFGLAPLFFLIALLIAPTLAVVRRDILDHPFWLLIIAVVSFTSFACLWLDKRRAEQERWRVPENFLHLLELAGGWPGSFVAQRLFRHKISKLSYQIVFWLIVVAYELLSVDFLLGWKIAQQLRQLAGL
ncbi:MAG: DUF1294 domain-containing protein [Nibricoccus sp.]